MLRLLQSRQLLSQLPVLLCFLAQALLDLGELLLHQPILIVDEESEALLIVLAGHCLSKLVEEGGDHRLLVCSL